MKLNQLTFLFLWSTVSSFVRSYSPNTTETLSNKKFLNKNETGLESEVVTRIPTKTAMYNVTTAILTNRSSKCEKTDDCNDTRKVCRNNSCICAGFHERMPESDECVANLTKISLWLKKSVSNETDSVSQPVAFIVKQTEPYTILTPAWSEYEAPEDDGLGVIPPVLIPVVICTVAVLILYAGIIFDYM